MADASCNDIETTKSSSLLVNEEICDKEKGTEVTDASSDEIEESKSSSSSVVNEEADAEVPDTSSSGPGLEDIPLDEIDMTARIWTLATLFAKAKEATSSIGKSKNMTNEENKRWDNPSDKEKRTTQGSQSDDDNESLSIYSGERNRLSPDLDVDINDDINYLKPDGQIESFNNCSIDEDSACSRYNIPADSIEVVDEESYLDSNPSTESMTNKKTKTKPEDGHDADSVCLQYSHANKSLKSLLSFDTLTSKQSSKAGRYLPHD